VTESLTAGKCSLPPGLADRPFAERLPHKLRQGRRAFGTRFRIIGDAGEELPQDGRATGHLQVRGPIVAAGYLKQDGVVGGTGVADGWLHTGDVARLYPDGGIELADRSKDVIKSGGEWISSVELENLAMGHPDVLEAAAIAVAHPKWQERPLLIVVRRPGTHVDAAGILDYLKPWQASWWLPDAVEFLDELPHTATGKVHKLSLRERFKDFRLPNA